MVKSKGNKATRYKGNEKIPLNKEPETRKFTLPAINREARIKELKTENSLSTR